MSGRPMTESSASIDSWAEATFGPVSDLTALVRRAELELMELREAINAGASADDIRAEAADVAILLHRLVALSGGDLGGEIDSKMAINRARQWVASGDGTGSHTPM
ncbi:MAG: hypothetical protein ACK5NN_02165 [Sphingomonadaceae bacterium]